VRSRLSTALRLARASSLPIVASNVLAAIALAGGKPPASGSTTRGADAFPAMSTVALAGGAMIAMFVAGCLLDDAFDRELDREHHPDRPIPAGEVRASLVFDLGFALLGAGVALVAAAAVATGAGVKPIVAALALATLIVRYAASHHGSRWAPVVLGLCRAGVYTTVALLVRPDLCAEVVVGATLAAAYLIALAWAARVRELAELPSAWPLALLALPFVLARPDGPAAPAVYAGFFVWVLRALLQLRGGRVRDAIGALTAGMALLDALLAANLGRIELAVASIACFLVTIALQAVLPAA